MKFGNKTYDRLKFVVLIVMPAITAFYVGFSQAWDLPNADKVATTLGLLTVLMGTVLQISNAQFKKDDDGTLEYVGVDEDTGIPELRLTTKPHVAVDPEKMLKKGTMTLKVHNSSGQKLKKMVVPTEAAEIVEH